LESITLLQSEISNTDNRIREIQKQLGSLDQLKQDAISKGDEATAIQALRDRGPLEPQLEEVKIKKAALEAKVRIVKANGPRAAEIRERIVKELFPKGVKACATLHRNYVGLWPALQEMDEVNGAIKQLMKEHEELIGESIQVPHIGLSFDEELGLRNYLNSGQWRPVEMVTFELTDPKLQAREVK
jgi:hypothetical protein